MSAFVVELERLLEGRGGKKFVLVFKGIDRQREAAPTLLPAIVRLGERVRTRQQRKKKIPPAKKKPDTKPNHHPHHQPPPQPPPRQHPQHPLRTLHAGRNALDPPPPPTASTLGSRHGATLDALHRRLLGQPGPARRADAAGFPVAVRQAVGAVRAAGGGGPVRAAGVWQAAGEEQGTVAERRRAAPFSNNNKQVQPPCVTPPPPPNSPPPPLRLPRLSQPSETRHDALFQEQPF